MPSSYGLAQWRWNDAEQSHEPPPGAFAVIDLRPVSEQAKAGQSEGWGFFSWPDQVYDESGTLVANMNAMPLDAVPLGYGDCREIQPNTATRDELRTRIGLSAQPAGATLIDCVSDVLGSLADPTGVSGPKPLLPTREGLLEIHLAYHSRVKAEAFNGAALFATTATGRNNRIREVLRSDLETAYASGGAELLAKVLGGWCDRWGVSYSQAAKWRNLIRGPMLVRLLDEGRGKFNPKKPRTSYSDDFNDGDLTGWTSVSGTWDNAGSTIRYPSSSSFGSIRYDSDVSSGDHWCDLLSVLSPGGLEHRIGPACRFTSSGRTYYGFRFSSTTGRLVKLIGGTVTNLGSTWSSSSHFTFRVQASGSTISGYENGTSKQSLTDTSITGNTRGGCACSSGGGAVNGSTADNYLIDDGVVAGGGPVVFYSHYRSQGW